MKRMLVVSCFLISSILAFGQQQGKVAAYFEYGKFELTPQAKATLDSLVDQGKAKTLIQIELRGYTDSDGSDQDNSLLSKARTTRVQQYLTSKGIPRSKIKSEYFGEVPSSTSQEEEAEKRRNRRVDISVRYKEDLAKKEATLPYATIDPKDIQTFTVTPLEKITIQGKRGTVITFPENAFVDQGRNPITSEITIELIEIYTKADMINYMIQTTSDGNLLETGGMVYINVLVNKKRAYLATQAFYQVGFPTKSKQKDMLIFYADTTSRAFNWQQAANTILSDFTYTDNKRALDRYIFDANKLGWINCDRFINTKGAKTDLLVSIADTNGVNFCLVFKSINSVMNVSDKKNGIKFTNIPVGEVVAIVAFKKEKSKTLFATKIVTIKKDQTEAITLESVTDQEFKDKIKKFY